jgi:hypothetical protein
VLVKASRAAALEWVVDSLATSFASWIGDAEAQRGAHPTGEEIR